MAITTYIDPIKMINFIHEGASADYQATVPIVNIDGSIDEISPILLYTSTRNEFINGLVNRIALVIVRNQIAMNPLAILKNGSIPLGKDIEEIFTNPAEVQPYEPDGGGLLSRAIPDTKVLYHTRNRQDMYTVTISEEQLRSAFTSWEKLGELTASVINSLYSGDNFDEFRLMKQTFSTAITENKIKIMEVPKVVDETTGKVLVKAIKNASKYFEYPSDQYNKYQDAMIEAGNANTTPVVTWTPQADQILLLRADASTNIDVDVLASAFNVGKVEFMSQRLEFDVLKNAPKVMAILMDKSFPQIYDNLFEVKEFYNARGMYWNYFLHRWQTYSYSLFCNVIAFVETANSMPELYKITNASVTTVPFGTTNTKVAIETAMLILANAELTAGYTASIESSSYTIATKEWVGKFKVTETADTTDTATDGMVRHITVVIAAS